MVFPVDGNSLQIAEDWCEHLCSGLKWGADDPLFPKTQKGLGKQSGFMATGLARERWSGSDPIRAIYKQASAAAGLPCINSYGFRDALTQLGERLCTSPEQLKAWSQNIGDEKMLAMLTS